jgi:hypothetical protein
LLALYAGNFFILFLLIYFRTESFKPAGKQNEYYICDTNYQDMKKLCSYIIFLFISFNIFSQETVINLSLSQSREIKVSSGANLIIAPDETITLGSEISVTGGTPAYAFSWSDNNGEIGNTQTIQVTKPGYYYLTVTDARNCSASDTLLVLALSSDPADLQDRIVLFPNPAQDKLLLESAGNIKINSIEILNLKGEIIAFRDLSESLSNRQVSIDLSEYLPGVYLMRIRTVNSEILKQFVKN